MASLTKYYSGLTAKMMADIDAISAQIDHGPETGRRNEEILRKFLEQHLQRRYAVTTGKIIAADGRASKQSDVIINDRHSTPALILDGDPWSIVPIEATYGVITVKTTLSKATLRDAIENIVSVRSLSKQDGLKPRSLIFAYKSEWARVGTIDRNFKRALENVPDPLRPNGLCVLDKCTIIRHPFTLETIVYPAHSLVHFFLFLVAALDSFTLPKFRIRDYLDDYPA